MLNAHKPPHPPDAPFYELTVTRERGWWVIRAVGHGAIGKAPTLASVHRIAREIVARRLRRDRASFGLSIHAVRTVGGVSQRARWMPARDRSAAESRKPALA